MFSFLTAMQTKDKGTNKRKTKEATVYEGKKKVAIGISMKNLSCSQLSQSSKETEMVSGSDACQHKKFHKKMFRSSCIHSW